MKYSLFVVVLALAGAAFADFDADCCSAEDRHELQAIWGQVWASAFTARREAIATALFDDLFAHYGSSKLLFERVGVADKTSAEYKAHLLRVTNGFDSVVHLLDDPLTLIKHLDHLADQHVARKGVTKEYFKGFGEAFSRILPQVISCFNVEAFGRCYTTIANRIAAKLP